MFTINDCSIMPLPKIHNRAGNITPIENNINVPFEVKRVYWLYDVPAGSERGGHAHKNLYQLIVAASGAFDITLEDGRGNKTITLNRPDMGLLIYPGIWRTLSNFSSGAISLVMASELYDENDYIRNYDEFLSYRK